MHNLLPNALDAAGTGIIPAARKSPVDF